MVSDAERRAAHDTHFDALFAADPDPWAYRTSFAERAKRRAVRAALGGRSARGLEIGCGNGESTAELAQAFTHLTALDASASAVDLAKERVGERSRCDVYQASLPEAFPAGPFDAIVATEVLYYLPLSLLRTTLQAAYARLAPNGRFVLTASIRPFGDRDVSHAVLFEEARMTCGAPHRSITGGAWRTDVFVRGAGPTPSSGPFKQRPDY